MQMKMANDTHTHTNRERERETEDIIGLVHYTKEEGSRNKNLQFVMLCQELDSHGICNIHCIKNA